ncbi:hypothetical protein B842_07795 [Corynebacterium humireducens NBRC 106098 = DSM 45392]|uniref:Uncharacterized protein n=1 Tax=Corynebacterium humireducens NBRC 106098 = DSM 45392 TaxID=1223515 RepID=A0A0B5DBA6_9CORY|nr:hypothetical protein [Corynebacterium humireducens]AJE33408.1 hypothetical protein B842_07795 [Corynebacterium humireducens NBRC 106098 = DSM 45392]
MSNVPQELATREKRVASRLDLGGRLWLFVAAVVLYAVSLVLPQAGSVRGYEVLFQLQPAADAGIKITEYVYAVLAFLGVGVLTTLTLLTRRLFVAIPAWMITTVGTAYSLFALWLRQTRANADDGVEMNLGFWISLLALVLAFLGYAMTMFRRNPEQEKLARDRASSDNLDEVGRMQQQANVSPEENPLLIDDRRSRASERHQKG